MKRTLVILALLLVAFPASLRAQTSQYEEFAAAAGSNSVLYRGMRAFVYNFRYNGTPYWEGPEFRKGDVLYNGRWYSNVCLLYTSPSPRDS